MADGGNREDGVEKEKRARRRPFSGADVAEVARCSSGCEVTRERRATRMGMEITQTRMWMKRGRRMIAE